MEPKLFFDLIKLFGKEASRLKDGINLPEAEQKAICQRLEETYRRIDTMLNMVITHSVSLAVGKVIAGIRNMPDHKLFYYPYASICVHLSHPCGRVPAS
jgi:hypothetical protein